MDFKNSLGGNTLLGRLLKGKTIQQQLEVLPLVSWNMPDTGCLPAPIRHNEWGVEVIYTHPLSTLAAVAHDEVFARALDLAHESQSERLYVRGEKNPVDIFDWIKVGVLAETVRYGTVEMLEKLLEKLVQREELTISSINYETNQDIPCPYKALAKSSSHHKEKLDLLVSYSVSRQAGFWVRSSPSQRRSIEKQARQNSFTVALNAALRVGSIAMIDAISQMGPGPLGWAQLTSKGISEACIFKRYDALAHAISLNGPKKPELDARELFYMLSSCAKHAERCLRKVHGKALSGVPGCEGWRENIDESSGSIAAARKVFLFLIEGLDGTTPMDSVSSPTKLDLHSLFLDTPAQEIDQAWDVLNSVGESYGVKLLPNLREWMIIDALPPTAWTQRIGQEMASLSSEQVRKFLAWQGDDLVQSWEVSVKENELEKIPDTFKAIERWWGLLPEGGRPCADALSWIDSHANEMPDEVKVYARRHMLDGVGKKSLPREQQASPGRSLKM